jgi:hypothetical protein
MKENGRRDKSLGRDWSYDYVYNVFDSDNRICMGIGERILNDRT